MIAKQLKKWIMTVPDEAIVEIERYGWEAVKPDKIRSMFVSSPTRTMDDVCNAEEVSS